MNDKERVIANLINPLEKIYGSLDTSVIDYYVEDFSKFDSDALKEIFIDVRKIHTKSHFPLISEIYQICGLSNFIESIGSKKTYHKQLYAEWLKESNF